MNRAACLLLPLALILAGCGQSAPSGIVGPPPLPSGVTVKFAPAPAGSYLALLTDEDEASEVVYQQRVDTGATSAAPNLNDWAKLSERAAALTLPGGETTKARLLFLKWGMWQDKNGNGEPDAGEWLDRMTHDRVVYASQDMQARFTTESPKMRQFWSFTQGWSRAEHYVYLPAGSDTYIRESKSTGYGVYELHEDTPITSM